MPTRSPLAIVALLTLGCTTPSAHPSPDPAGPVVASVAPSVTASASAVASASAAPTATAGTSARVALSPAEAADLLARAEKCLADASCPDDGEALYRRADDAGAKGVSCFRFYYGIGVAPDLPRARACFEREVAAGPACKDESPNLDRVFLAAMLVDAQGGPADPERAKALFAGCVMDGSVQGVLEEVPKRSQPDPSRAPLDFCKDIGGTTYSMGQCHRIDRERLSAERMRVDKLLFPRLDAEGKKLAVKARDAWSAFADKQGKLYGDKYRGGSLQGNAWAGHENMLQQRRVEAMTRFFDYKPAAGADPAAAERDLDKAHREACEGDAERKKICADSRKAWNAYRDAEVALYTRVHRALGEKEVARDVKTTLARQYQADLEDVVKP